jgi:hypothetical protein
MDKAYEDTNAITLNKITPFKFNIDFIFDWIDNSKDPLIPFLVWELCLGLFFFIIIVILPDYFLNIDNNLTLASMSAGNIIKLRRVASKNKWQDIIVKLNNRVFSRNLLTKYFSDFWNNVSDQFTNNNHMFILFKIKYNNGEFSSIGKVQRINITDLNWYIDFIIEQMKFKSEYYNEIPIVEFIFSYGFKDGKIPNKTIKKFEYNQNIKGIKIPISMIPSDFGTIVKTIKSIFIIQNELGQTITLEQIGKNNLISIASKRKVLISFEDKFIEENKFVRILDNKKYYFINNKEIVKIEILKPKFIDILKPSKDLVNKFITLDIETYIENGDLIPYLISFYDGIKCYNFWIEDYKSTEDMVLDCFTSIFVRKYDNYSIYMHNMAKFDIIFLLKYLVKHWTLDPRIHNGRIISIKVNSGKYNFELKDSYLILLASLDKLCNSFQVESVKAIFPHLFITKNNLNYEGKVPEIQHFIKINNSKYNEYFDSFNSNWNLKKEAIKYCNIDCVSLYQILIKFNELIFELFRKNIHHYPTLPSLAFGIFRTKFMEENLIPQLAGKIAEDIRSGYTGGSVDMFIPKSKNNKNINCYDVNSLYPSQMHKQLMPIGKPTYFKGDIRKIDPNAFGFFHCKIIAPDDIKHPILQTHIKTANGIRTLSPIGSWEDIIFSPEMDNAKKFGYKFEILWGYTFEQKIIFREYVDFLYSLRLNYNKSNPLNFIAKILLNSLYGRFGMNDNFANITIIDKDFYPDFENKYLDNIVDKIDLGDWLLIFYQSPCEQDNEIHNVSIAIAAAITAYARVHMSKFKNNPNINLYYTDTDSIYTDSELDSSFIDSKTLGKLKLEHVCKRAIFLTPKVYCLETIEGEFIYKIKGLKKDTDLSFQDFEKLLIKNSLIKKNQNKWSRNLSEAKITILNQIYTLKVTENKRRLIYDKNNKLIFSYFILFH